MSDMPAKLPIQSLGTGQVRPERTELSASERESAREFEKLFLSQFVDEMLKTVDLSEAGGGEHSHMWRSFMAEAMAENLVDQGGFGLTGNIEQMMSAYKRS